MSAQHISLRESAEIDLSVAAEMHFEWLARKVEDLLEELRDGGDMRTAEQGLRCSIARGRQAISAKREEVERLIGMGVTHAPSGRDGAPEGTHG